MNARACIAGILALAVTACSHSGGMPPPLTPTVREPAAAAPASAAATPPPYSHYLAQQEAWLAAKTLGDGAIAYTDTEIEPYYANIAATGEIAVRGKLGRVRAWMRWYVAHLNKRDKWGLSGTIYDYSYDKAGRETSKNGADSVDSYAATFFTLALTLYEFGGPDSQRFVASLARPIDVMGAMVLKIQQRDGMTIALPDYPVAYLMDNCEVYRGLRDLAVLEREAFGDDAKSRRYSRAALRVERGIASLWYPSRANYDVERQEPGGPSTHARWTVWYPDATAQLFPMLQGVILEDRSRGKALYAAFNVAYPRWDRLDFPDQFPWALVAATAFNQGDSARVNAYVQSVQHRFSPSFAWPWYDLEAGWYMRTLGRVGVR